jgi:hypothetical protein
MSDFFGALELELRAAAERTPRRGVPVRQAAGAAAAAVLVAAAVVIVAVVVGGGGEPASVPAAVEPSPVGTVIPKGEGTPPRPQRSVVVATGTMRYAGPWQLETYPSEVLKDPESGEVMQPAGLRCLMVILLDPPRMRGPTGAGSCGALPRTPGFTRAQMNVPIPGRTADGRRVHAKQVLIFGRTPERAQYVQVTTHSGVRMRIPVADGPRRMRGDYYLTAVPPRLGAGARINWLDEDGRPGSRGVALLPPVTPH